MGNVQGITLRRYKRLRLALRLVGGLAVAAAFSTAAVQCQRANILTHAPAGTFVDARTCAAQAVYQLVDDDYGLRATVANAVLNSFSTPRASCSISPPVGPEESLDPQRWQSALDVVDAVASGSYTVSPTSCARANAFAPLTNAPRAQCVYGDLAFVGGDA